MSDIRQNSNNLVSVIIPVYNGGKYIEECLESIRNQTYINFECIINNNKSTDNTLEIAETFAASDKRFKVFNNDEFLKQADNWNISISRISDKSKYIKIVPADDWVFPEYLEKKIGLLDKYPNIGICSSYRLDETKVICDGLDYYKGPVFYGKDILYHQLIKDIEITGSINTVMYRNSILKKLPEYPKIFNINVYHLDTMLAYEVLKRSDLGFVFQVLSFTRRHNETLTSKISNKYNTHINFDDIALGKNLSLFPDLESFYKKRRLDYAFYLLKRRIFRDKKCIDWHRKHLENPITFSEYFRSILSRLLLLNRLVKYNRSKLLKQMGEKRV